MAISLNFFQDIKRVDHIAGDRKLTTTASDYNFLTVT